MNRSYCTDLEDIGMSKIDEDGEVMMGDKPLVNGQLDGKRIKLEEKS